MKLSEDTNHLILSLEQASDLNKKQIKELFKCLVAISLLSKDSSNCVELPYLGKIHFNYEGDKLVKEGKRAILSADVRLNDYFLKNVGQLKDGVESEIERFFQNKVEVDLGEKVDLEKPKV